MIKTWQDSRCICGHWKSSHVVDVMTIEDVQPLGGGVMARSYSKRMRRGACSECKCDKYVSAKAVDENIARQESGEPDPWLDEPTDDETLAKLNAPSETEPLE